MENPFAFDFVPSDEPAAAEPAPAAEAPKAGPLITAPGAHPEITIEQYHGPVEICPGPSISSTGLKKLVPFNELQTKGSSPRHFWEGSNLNPNRKSQEKSDALVFGSAFHDALLEPERWLDPAIYHRLPEGFSRKATVKQAEEIAAADAAAATGVTLITAEQHLHITAMVKAVREHPGANALLLHGVAEVTLAWQDAETGVWLRCRPDWIPFGRPIGVNVKSTKDASHSGFQSDVTKYRYAQSAALEMDGLIACADALRALFPKFKPPAHYLHPVVEKPGTGWEPGDYLPVALWQLPPEDIKYGRALNRRAIDLFAKCLSEDRWPGYADEPAPCGISGWSRKQIDNAIQKEAA